MTNIQPGTGQPIEPGQSVPTGDIPSIPTGGQPSVPTDQIVQGQGPSGQVQYTQDPYAPAIPNPADPNTLSDKPYSYAPYIKPDDRFYQIYYSQAATNPDTKSDASPEQLINYSYNPEQIKKLPPEQQEVVTKDLKLIDDATREQVLSEFPDLPKSWKPTRNETTYNNFAQKTYKDALDQALSTVQKDENLSDKQVAELKYAFYNEDDPEIDPKIKSMSATLSKNVQKVISKDLGLPEEFNLVKPDKGQFELEKQASFDYEFMDHLRKSLKPDEFKQARSDYYNKAKSPTLEKALAEFTTTFKEQHGIPPKSAWTATPRNDHFNRSMEFSAQNSAMEWIEQNVPASLRDSFVAYAKNPTGKPSPEIKDLHQKMVTHVNKQMQKEWGAQPKISLANMNENSAAVGSVLGTATGYEKVLDNLSKSLPAGAEKNTLLDTLAAVSQALQELKELVFRIQAEDAKAQQEVALGHMDAKITAAKIRAKDAAEAAKKKDDEKSGPLKVFSDIAKWVGYALMVVMACLTANPAIIAATLLIIAAIELATAFGKEITQLVTKMAEKMAKAFGSEELAAVIICVMAAALVAATGGIALVFLANCEGLIAAGLQALGMSEMAAMIVGMIIQIIVMIAVIVVQTVMTAGAGAGAQAGRLAGKVADAAQKTAKLAKEATTAAQKIGVVVNRLKTVMLKAMNFFNNQRKAIAIAEGVKGFTEGGITFGTNLSRGLKQLEHAEELLERGEIQAFLEELKGLIKALEKLKMKLMGEMDGLGEWGEQIGEQMNALYKDAGSVMTNIAKAA